MAFNILNMILSKLLGTKLLTLVLLLILDVAPVICKDCLMTNQCKCGFDDGSGSVDITSLGHTDNTPR